MASRPQVLQGTTHAVETGSGRVYVTVNLYEGALAEVFASLGRCGSEERALTEALGRVISLALRCGVPLERIKKQLRGISSESTVGLGPNKVLSVPDAIGRVLEEYIT